MTNRIGIPLALVAALSLTVVLSIQNRSLRARTERLERRLTEPFGGMTVPAFQSAAVAGDTVAVAGPLSGTLQVVALFTTTCPYCRASLGAWNAIATVADILRRPKFSMVGIALDSQPAARALAARERLRFPVTRFPDARVQRVWHARSVPATLVVNAEGRVVWSHVGHLDERTLVDSVIGALRWGMPPEHAVTLR